MKKLKQALSLTLALILSLSLAVPAFAAEHSLYPDSFSYQLDLPEVEKDITIHSVYDVPAPNTDSNSMSDTCYYIFNKDSEFKVSNVSDNQKIAIEIYPYKWDDRGIYDYYDRDGVYALQEDGTWTFWVGDEGGIGQAGFLKPGMSITYKMPNSATEKDVLYVMFIYVWDSNVPTPDEGGAYNFEYGCFLPEGSALIDSSAAQPTAPAEPETPAQPAEQPAASGSANYKVNTSTGTVLNVRTGPGIKYKKAAPALPQGAEVEIAEIDGDWGKLADGSGWVYMLALDKLAGTEPAQPVPPAAPAEIPEDALAYTVKEGDTLGFITVNFYGSNRKSAALYKANKAAFQATKGKLVPGMTLVLPATIGKTARIPAPVAGEGEKLYTVQLGDTLGKIAAAEYGKVGDYKAIFERNQDRLKSANTIYEGQVIVLPVIEK